MSKDQKYTSKQGNDYEIKGGVHTGYSYKDSDGNRSILGFDHPNDVKDYIDKREEGERHFMDKDPLPNDK